MKCSHFFVEVVEIVRTEFLSAVGNQDDITSLRELRRNPLILLLDKQLQRLPWENIPLLRENPGTISI
jgi:hypothetical protein